MPKFSPRNRLLIHQRMVSVLKQFIWLVEDITVISYETKYSAAFASRDFHLATILSYTYLVMSYVDEFNTEELDEQYGLPQSSTGAPRGVLLPRG